MYSKHCFFILLIYQRSATRVTVIYVGCIFDGEEVCGRHRAGDQAASQYWQPHELTFVGALVFLVMYTGNVRNVQPGVCESTLIASAGLGIAVFYCRHVDCTHRRETEALGTRSQSTLSDVENNGRCRLSL